MAPRLAHNLQFEWRFSPLCSNIRDFDTRAKTVRDFMDLWRDVYLRGEHSSEWATGLGREISCL